MHSYLSYILNNTNLKIELYIGLSENNPYHLIVNNYFNNKSCSIIFLK
jgi:hypothetical protein